LTKLDKYLIR